MRPADRTARRHAEMPLLIIHAFLGGIVTKGGDGEDAVNRVLADEEKWSEEALALISKVFEPIFLHYPNGIQDRTVWHERDTAGFIRNWKNLLPSAQPLAPRSTSTATFCHRIRGKESSRLTCKTSERTTCCQARNTTRAAQKRGSTGWRAVASRHSLSGK